MTQGIARLRALEASKAELEESQRTALAAVAEMSSEKAAIASALMAKDNEIFDLTTRLEESHKAQPTNIRRVRDLEQALSQARSEVCG